MTPMQQGGGLLASVRALLGTALALLQTRLELLTTEVQEEQIRVGAILRYGLAAFFFLGFGVILLAMTLTVFLWDSHRLLALGCFTAVFLLFGLLALYAAQRRVKAGSKMFAASLAELAADREALKSSIRDQ
jgi:uncharacterized membrane protein YqjE